MTLMPPSNKAIVKKSVLLSLLGVFLASINSFASGASNTYAPYLIDIDGGNIQVRNISERYLQIKLEIEGHNFISQFPCTTQVYLSAHRNWHLKVAPKDKNTPLNYKIMVTEFSAKTYEQLKAEQKGKSLPIVKPATRDAIANLKTLTCQSH